MARRRGGSVKRRMVISASTTKLSASNSYRERAGGSNSIAEQETTRDRGHRNDCNAIALGDIDGFAPAVITCAHRKRGQGKNYYYSRQWRRPEETGQHIVLQHAVIKIRQRPFRREEDDDAYRNKSGAEKRSSSKDKKLSPINRTSADHLANQDGDQRRGQRHQERARLHRSGKAGPERGSGKKCTARFKRPLQQGQHQQQPKRRP
ncbi:MAG: hypothetical protein DME46_09540 [Verrucomicrobia bacterium]|nr:MAG: hypothetical protein DME46_09540 [Verrucomicrobiota bacterium]